MTTKSRAARTPESVVLADECQSAPGTLIVRFRVPGRPVPWSVPFVYRNGGSKKNEALVAWQSVVALHARLAMGNRPPMTGPIELSFLFTVRPPHGRQRTPDLTNLLKGVEDALANIVFVNDRMVCRQTMDRVFGEDEGVVIEVRAFRGQ